MSGSTALNFGKLLMLFILTTCYGCAGTAHRFYVPKQIPIEPGVVLKQGFNAVKMIAIENSQTKTNEIQIGEYTHEWFGDMHLWTDTAVGIAKTELQKRDIAVPEDAARTLRLSITRAHLSWEFRVVRCTLNLEVEMGNGHKANLEVSNESLDLYGSCDGAVAKAVAAMFNYPVIQDYLVSSRILKDSDCDGVPDERDECPDTPRGVQVDSRGCPLDSDGDGVPDYMDECPDTPSGVQVDSRGCPLDSDGDGVPDYMDECPDTPMGVQVDSRGCPLDSDGDGVPDYMDECPDTPEGAKVDEQGCWVIDGCYFDFDKHEIKPLYYSALDNVLTVLRDTPNLKISIQGHADSIGSKEYNQDLSEKRAGAVMEYLVANGIDKGRLSAVGYGLSRPRAPNKTETGRALNRRVEFIAVH